MYAFSWEITSSERGNDNKLCTALLTSIEPDY